MRRVTIARTEAEIERLRPYWDALVSQQADATLFQRFDVNWLAASHFSCREEPHFIFSESKSSTAIIPSVLRESGEIALAGEELFDYRDVISGSDPSALSNAWAEAAHLARPLLVTAIRGEGARERWANFTTQPFAAAPCIRRAQVSAEKFMESHTRLGSRARKLARKGVQLCWHHGTESKLVRWIYEQKATQQGSLFADELRREFMVRLAAHRAAQCDIFTYEHAAEVVAALVTFRTPRVRHFYTIYFNLEWADFSPGQLLVFQVAARTLFENLDCDLMTGEQPYKTRIATSSVPLYRIEADAQAVARAAEHVVHTPTQLAA